MAGVELKYMTLQHDAKKIPEFGYGNTPDVVTQLELDALANVYWVRVIR